MTNRHWAMLQDQADAQGKDLFFFNHFFIIIYIIIFIRTNYVTVLIMISKDEDRQHCVGRTL